MYGKIQPDEIGNLAILNYGVDADFQDSVVPSKYKKKGNLKNKNKGRDR